MLMTFVQGAVSLAVLVIAGFVLHRAWRRLRSTAATLSIVVAAMGASVVGTTPARAAVIEADMEVYTLREGDVINTDLVVSADEVRIEGLVVGDLIVAAGRVHVAGEVQGDVLGFAETIDITGSVGGNVRTGSRRLQVEGEVARNITAVAGVIRLARTASLGGSVITGAREVAIDAAVPRDIIVAAKTTVIDGRVTGSARIAGERLSIGANGAIGGDATFHGRDEPDVDAAAELASPIEFERAEEHEEHPVVAWVTSFFYFWTAAFLFGAVLLLVTPEATEEIVTKNVPEYGRSFVNGVVSAAILLVSGLIITFTVVGAPLGVTVLFLLGVGLYVAQVYVAAHIGREILGTPTSASSGLVRLALGLLVVQLAKSLPFLWFVVMVLITFWGFGALAVYMQDRFRGTVQPPQAPTGPLAGEVNL